MELKGIKIGFVLTGSFSAFQRVIPKMKELIIMVTVGVISLSLLTMLVPIKERTLKFLISIVFLCIIIIPFFKFLPTIKTNKITVSTPQIENEVFVQKSEFQEGQKIRFGKNKTEHMASHFQSKQPISRNKMFN